MSEQPHSLTFWNLRDARDYPLLLELNRSSRLADGDPTPVTLEAIADVLAHMDGMTQEQGVILVSVGDTPIGYSRLGWYSSRPQTRLYYQISFIVPEQRAFWPALCRNMPRKSPVRSRLRTGIGSKKCCRLVCRSWLLRRPPG